MELLIELIYKNPINHLLFAFCLFGMTCIWALRRMYDPGNKPLTEKELLKIIKKEPELKPHLVNFDGILTFNVAEEIKAVLAAEKAVKKSTEDTNKTIQAQKQVLDGAI